MITSQTRVSEVLDAHPELVELLAEFHPHFKQLRNRLLRRMMAPRITVGQAARIAGVPAEALLAMLRRSVGEPEPAPACAPDAHDPTDAAVPREPRPAPLDGLTRVDVDVRADIARGVEPFARIMAAVKGLGEGQALVLRAPFEPIPLYDVLGKRGLAHWTECHGPQDWSVWFYRGTVAETAAGPASDAASGARPGRAIVDVRGLEPPQPMVRVLEMLDGLGATDELLVVHDRRPMFLYPQLDDRGFVHETREVSPGLVEILIRRGPRS